MSSVLIIGYGNTLRGDDGAGWLAAEQLLKCDLPPEITVRQLHQLAPELASELRDVDYVLFVDATRQGVPGDVCVQTVPAPGSAGFQHARSDAGFTHQFTPSSMLRLTSDLYGAAPAGFEVSLCGGSFDLSDELTPVVATAFPRFLSEILGLAYALRRDVERAV